MNLLPFFQGRELPLTLDLFGHWTANIIRYAKSCMLIISPNNWTDYNGQHAPDQLLLYSFSWNTGAWMSTHQMNDLVVPSDPSVHHYTSSWKCMQNHPLAKGEHKDLIAMGLAPFCTIACPFGPQDALHMEFRHVKHGLQYRYVHLHTSPDYEQFCDTLQNIACPLHLSSSLQPLTYYLLVISHMSAVELLPSDLNILVLEYMVCHPGILNFAF